MLLALDWRKGLDSIAPERLILAMERFGLSADMLTAIRNIYTDRSFVVVDGGKSRPNVGK